MIQCFQCEDFVVILEEWMQDLRKREFVRTLYVWLCEVFYATRFLFAGLNGLLE